MTQFEKVAGGLPALPSTLAGPGPLTPIPPLLAAGPVLAAVPSSSASDTRGLLCLQPGASLGAVQAVSGRS